MIWKRSKRRCRSSFSRICLTPRISAAQRRSEKFRVKATHKCHFIEQFTKPDEKSPSIKRQVSGFLPRPAHPSTGKSKPSSCSTSPAPTGWETKRIPSSSGFMARRFFSPRRISTPIWQASRSQKARPSRPRPAARPVFDSGARRPGPHLLASKGGIIRKEMEDWIARRVSPPRLLTGLHPARIAPSTLPHFRPRGYYSDNMFDAMELDDAEYRLKPMNCPGHISSTKIR